MSPTISGTLANQAGPSIRHKVNLATPAYKGEYTSAYVRSLYSLLSATPSAKTRFSFSEVDYSDIVTSRNYLISNFYFNKTDCSHILFIDSDMGFPHQLIGDMLALNEEVVGVSYPKRTLHPSRLHALNNLPFQKAYAQSCDFIGIGKTPHPTNPAFRRADGCGTGILLISRSCINAMIEKCPDIVDNKRFRQMPFAERFDSFITPFNKILLDDRELSEDLSFCQRWINHCDGKIYVNIAHEIEHVGSVTVKCCYTESL